MPPRLNLQSPHVGAEPSRLEQRTYSRARDLPRLVPLWPSEIEDESIPARLQLIAKLKRALREERRRGLAGHWTYDLGRHAGLLRAYRGELAELRARGKATRPLEQNTPRATSKQSQ